MGICEGCHAGCCRSFAVPLTGADIIRIERDQQLTFWDFVVRWADEHGAIARNYAPHFRFRDEPHTDFVIALMQTESASMPGSSKCQFLAETPPTPETPLGTASCGIYGARPSACRAFPTKLNSTSEVALVHDVPERGRPGDHPAYSLCPRPWEPSDVDPINALGDLVVARFEMTFFHKVAAVWNRELRDWAIFPSFLREVYANRVLRESQVTGAVVEDRDEPSVDEMPDTIPLPVLRDAPSRRAA